MHPVSKSGCFKIVYNILSISEDDVCKQIFEIACNRFNTSDHDDIPRWIRNSDWLFKAGTTINLENVKHCPNLRNHAICKKYK